jgi:hypothetical protein
MAPAYLQKRSKSVHVKGDITKNVNQRVRIGSRKWRSSQIAPDELAATTQYTAFFRWLMVYSIEQVILLGRAELDELPTRRGR